MDPLVISMAVTMFMVWPTLLAMDPSVDGKVQRKLGRELFVRTVIAVMTITTLVTIYIIASQPTPQRIAVHWRAATNPLIMVAAACAPIVHFSPLGPHNRPTITVTSCLVVMVWTGTIYIVIAIAMHIAVYICLFFEIGRAHV